MKTLLKITAWDFLRAMVIVYGSAYLIDFYCGGCLQ